MSGRNVMRVLLAVLLVFALVWGLQHRDQLTVEAIRGRLDAFGALAPLVFIGAYAVATVAFLPGSVFTIAGGALFGPWLGTLVSLVGATVGATTAFFIARYLASDWVARRAGGRLKRLVDGVDREGWRFVAFTRLVPLFPFNLLNYALGLTRIPWPQYVVASVVCMAPGAVAYTWLGHAGAKAIAGGRGTLQAALIALALVATVAFLPRFVRRMRDAEERNR